MRFSGFLLFKDFLKELQYEFQFVSNPILKLWPTIIWIATVPKPKTKQSSETER